MEAERAAILALLQNSKNDNLARAWEQFRGCDFLTMCAKYGESSKTCFEILGDYIQDEQRRQELMLWLQEVGRES